MIHAVRWLWRMDSIFYCAVRSTTGWAATRAQNCAERWWMIVAWRGWRKNVFLGSRGGLFFVLLSLPGLPTVTVFPFLLPLRLWLARLAGKRKTVGIAEAVFLSVLELGPLLTYRRWIDKEMQLPWYYMFTHPLAGSLFVGILAQSTWRIRAGKGVDWSGRRYYLRNSPAKP